ncbi:MAG: AMP-binding protein, partial [Anaerolineae bacterium]|nr:AMP-binding protein [Anaerolineae bacterium]
EDVLLSVTTLSFDISVLEIFLPLITGAQIVLVSRETAADGLALQAKLAESGANVMQATPTTWRLLIDSGWPGNDNLKVMCGGEALPRELANQILERCDTLWNMYGPTETTIWSTVYQLQPGETGGVSIGRPIGNTQCYILDSYLQPVPIGVPGELHIGGDGLARGYLNRPELTAEKFIHDP